MTKLTTPVLLIILSVGLFFMYVDPTYNNVQEIIQEQERFDQALDKSKELQTIRDELLAKYNTFSTSDLDRLAKLLPDNVDNVRLVLDIDHIASAYGMRIKDVSINTTEERKAGTIGPNQDKHESVTLSFSMTSSYDNLTKFIRDLEKSLRIVDLTEISLIAMPSQFDVEGVEIQQDLYKYSISLKTYWLK
jgi:Tfp pilus assembly protein PilO